MLKRLMVRLMGERGASSVEYGVVAFLVTAVVITAVVALGLATDGNFDCAGRAWTTQSSC